MENAERGSERGFDPVSKLLLGSRANGELVEGRRVRVDVDDGESVVWTGEKKLGSVKGSVFPGLGGLGGFGSSRFGKNGS